MGYKGQSVFVSPSKDLIIIRLGKNEGGEDWEAVFEGIKEGVE